MVTSVYLRMNLSNMIWMLIIISRNCSKLENVTKYISNRCRSKFVLHLTWLKRRNLVYRYICTIHRDSFTGFVRLVSDRRKTRGCVARPRAVAERARARLHGGSCPVPKNDPTKNGNETGIRKGKLAAGRPMCPKHCLLQTSHSGKSFVLLNAAAVPKYKSDTCTRLFLTKIKC